MKLVKLNCPSCGAPLEFEDDMKIIFCKYCGQKIWLDDEVVRKESTENINITHRKIDEARIRETEFKEKQYNDRKKRISFKDRLKAGLVFLVIVFIVVNSIKARVNSRIEKSYETKIGKEVSKACKNNQASLDELKIHRKNITIEVEASSALKNEIDQLQDDILDVVDIKKDYKLSLRISYPQYNQVRNIDVNEYGKINVIWDETNTISEEQIKQIIESYSEAIEKSIGSSGMTLSNINYSQDILTISIESGTSNRAKIQTVVDNIISVNKSLDNLEINISTLDEGDLIQKINIKPDGTQSGISDYSNEMTDEEAEALIEEYLKPVKKACEKNDMDLNEIKVREDTLNIRIVADSKDKDEVDRLAKAINNNIEDLTVVPIKVRVTTDNMFDTVREWTIDEKRLIDIGWDRTE